MGGWEPGDQVVLREIWGGRVWTAMPAVVVADLHHDLRFFIPVGTSMKYAVDDQGRERRLYSDRWELADHVTGRSVLSFGRPGTQHAILALWDPDWSFTGWYVNLEAALGRDDRTYDYVDHCLDVLVPPDRSAWTWKDEEELEAAVRGGIFTAKEAEAFRSEGRRAVRRLLDREPPFDTEWSEWRPDPAWPIPVLQDGWDRDHR